MRVSQCAMMLNYGEPQILELMKNTFPSRLYPILFPINNLRDAITTAKWVMIKEKIDRQKTGQSPATSFMRVNDCSQSSDKSGKKGVTFDAMETLERHSNSIDKLISPISKINVKMDRKETPYKPRVYQNRPIGQSRGKQQNFQPHNRSFSRDRNRNRGNYNYNNRNNRPNYRDRSRDNYRYDDRDIPIGLMKDTITTDQTTEGETTIGKTMETDKIIEVMTLDRDMEIGVKVERDPEIILVTEPEVGIEVETEEGKCKMNPELCQMTEEDQGLGLTLE